MKIDVNFRFHANLQEFKPRAQTKIQYINEVSFEQSKPSINSDTNSKSLLQFFFLVYKIYIIASRHHNNLHLLHDPFFNLLSKS